MAVNTQDKRASASHVPWAIIGPVPDGSLGTAADRTQCTGFYSGALALTDSISIIFQGFDVISGSFVVLVGSYKET